MTASLQNEIQELKASPADYLPLARRIGQGRYPELIPIRVGLMASFTAAPLEAFLVVEAARRGFAGSFFLGGYNQVEQLVLDPASPLYRYEPDVIVLALRLENVLPEFDVGLWTEERAGEQITKLMERIGALILEIRRRSRANILVWNFAEPARVTAGLADAAQKVSQSGLIRRFNESLAEVCRKHAGVHVFDLHRLSVEIGLGQFYEPKLLWTSRLPYSAEAQCRIARMLARYLKAIHHPPKKCLVLDLDNTLWGGVLGEDGIGGIALGEDYPGNVFKDFQRYLLGLRDRGILLAIASKNDETEVREVFQRHPDCVLKLDHFSSVQVGWQDKASSLRAIAGQLNIGTDALAFFDDQPVEREFVREQMPDVMVIEPGPTPMHFARAIDQCGAFDQLGLSDEDGRRAAQYQAEESRSELRAAHGSLEDFLAGLNMTATCGEVSAETLPRVAQLFAKTNQLNLTTRRHGSAQVQAMIDTGAVAAWMRLEDRFGDNGLIGVCIAVPESEGQWRIDSLLLSCRVIGRRAEAALLSVVSRLVRDRRGRVLMGEYIPTPKNGPAAGVYEQCGFKPVDAERRLWKWDLSRGDVACPDFIRVEANGKNSGS